MTKKELEKEIENLKMQNQRLRFALHSYKRLISVGNQLSNVAYNFGQSSSDTSSKTIKYVKETLWDLCKKWDEAKGNIQKTGTEI